MSPPRPSDDGPLAAIFMLCLLLIVAGGGIWYAVREKPRGGPGAGGPGIEKPWESGRRSLGNGPRFVEAFKRLPSDATSLQRAADDEFDSAAKLLNAEELAQVNKILARKGGSRDAYSESDFEVLRRHGLGKWLRAQTISWSQSDPVFQKVGESVWSARPSARQRRSDRSGGQWGELDKMTRTKILAAVQAVEGKSRELSSDEREMVVNFAGEDYLNNRP